MTEPADDDLGFPLPPPARGSKFGVIAVTVIVVGGAFAFGYFRRGAPRYDAPEVGAPAAIKVETVKPTMLSSDRALALPGVVRPLEETALYARVSGYVRAWHGDIGDKVTAGQVLVEIDTPEVAAELAQARAQLAAAKATVQQAIAQRDFSSSTSSRYSTLAAQNAVSRQEADETTTRAASDRASVAAAESNVAAMEANVRRLVELQTFTRIVAPFAGTITTRAVNRGALVQPGGTVPLYTVVATDPVRVYIDVPQTIAPSVKPDTDATISVREYAGRAFAGKVTRAAGALDPELHTMTTEIRIPNPDGALLPGMYVQAQLSLPTPHQVFEIPATALYADAEGVRVATVDAQRRVKFVKLGLERDTGATLQVATGLRGDEQIVKIAVPTLRDGDAVEVVTAPAPAAK